MTLDKKSNQINIFLTIKILITTRAFIRIINFCKEGSGHLLEATVFENFKIFKFSFQ